MLSRRAGVCVVALLAAVGMLATTANAFVYWDGTGPELSANGSASWFDWANGGSDGVGPDGMPGTADDVSLFGNPVLVNGNTFAFTPDDFRADSANGVSETTGDRMEVDVAAHTGYSFERIRIIERGDYGILGGGEVTATAALALADWNNFRFPQAENSVTYDVDGSGNWTVTTEIDLSSDIPEWTDFELVLSNNLMAISDSDGTSYIQKDLTGVAIEVILLPEPATLVGLVGMLLVALRRR